MLLLLLLLNGEEMEEKEKENERFEKMGWFEFDLVVGGYRLFEERLRW